MGLYEGHQNRKRLPLCGAPVGVPRGRNFVVYLADKDHPSVLHMVIIRATACNFFSNIFLCERDKKNVERIVGSSHFFP